MASTSVMTPKCRLAFPNLFEARPFQGQENGKKYFGAILLFDDAARKTPEFKAMVEAMKSVRQEQWGKDQSKWPEQVTDAALVTRGPFFRGDTKQQYDGFAGCVYINAKSLGRPGIVARDRTVISREIGNDNEIYAGAYVRVTLSCFSYVKPKAGISFWMNNVQKISDGPSLTSRKRPDEDFEALPDEDGGVAGSIQAGGTSITGGNVEDLFK